MLQKEVDMIKTSINEVNSFILNELSDNSARDYIIRISNPSLTLKVLEQSGQ